MAVGKIEWCEADDDYGLEYRYKHERDGRVRVRWQALWLLRRGKSRTEVCDATGVNERTLRDWIHWYREGGCEAVGSHRACGKGNACRLSAEQREEIIAKAGAGVFRKVADVREWVKDNWGIEYTYYGMWAVLDRLHIHPKVPRPIASKADVHQQEDWKKGGCVKLSWHKA
jgi:transposase